MDRITRVLVLLAALAGTSCQSPKIDSNYPWLIYYGERLSPEDVRGIRMAILEPDHVQADRLKRDGTRFIGYLSAGEANDSRGYWPLIAGKDFLVEPNPDWKGAWRVDARSREWRELLLTRLIPDIFAKGYDGLFLDTVDTASYLEEKDPEKYAGSRRAMVELVLEIRRRYPDKMILPNNGLDLLDEFAAAVDGVVVEDLHTRYDFSAKLSRRTPDDVANAKEAVLDRFRNLYRKPVFNVLYETDPRSELARSVIRRSREKGYHWYVTTVDLQSLP